MQDLIEWIRIGEKISLKQEKVAKEVEHFLDQIDITLWFGPNQSWWEVFSFTRFYWNSFNDFIGHFKDFNGFSSMGKPQVDTSDF